MKYFSISSVVEAYNKVSVSTKEKFWGILGILHSIDETICPNKSYSVETGKLSQFFEDLFRMHEKRDYSGTDEYSFVFSNRWVDVVSEDYLVGRPDIVPILVWAYRNHSFPNEISTTELFNKFLEDYHITKEIAENIFNISFAGQLEFEDNQYSDGELLLRLGGSKASGNTTLKLNGSFVVANPGDLARGPYFQPLYAALQTLKCLTIYPFNIHEYYDSDKWDNNKGYNGVIDDVSRQIIYYGAPGTGKSHKINECTQGDDTVIRTTFHPDSDYSTFVGCYKPTKETTNTLNLYKLHELYTEFKSKVSNSPLHRFITKYHDSFRLLTEKEAELVFDKIETSSTVSAEVPKIMSAIEEISPTQTITYSFVKQAFTKAYIQAWEKMCDSNFSVSSPIRSIGAATSPYSTTGKRGVGTDFDYTSKGATLSTDEKKILLQVDNFDFQFQGINNYAELHKNVNVVVTDEPTENQKERYHRTLTLTAKQIQDLYAKWKNYSNKYGYLSDLLGIISRKLHVDRSKLEKYIGEDVSVEVNDYYKLLGLYDPTDRTVYLFKNNIGNDKDMLCAVYVHEMFHAYFNSPYKYIPEIEEPIVECCTLCFLELFDNRICNNYQRRVEQKKWSMAISYYGFGSHLFENRSLDWMNIYQNGFDKIDINSDIVNLYRSKFFPVYCFDEESDAMDILYNILVSQSMAEYDKSAQFLIIEEINRGNCAQIFGDLFQLLDRKGGYSEYPIEPDEDLRRELKKEFDGLRLDTSVKNHIDNFFKENYPNGITDKILKGELLVLPENLYIWATMNTSDQSLFPIDSAFKRRWDWKYIPIKEHADKNYKIEIGDKTYDWWGFLERINKVIGETTSSEDKKLGYFFVKTETSKVSDEQFVGKVLFYIWNDVFKNYGFDHNIFSKGEKDKFVFSDFFNSDGTPNKDNVQMFLKRLEETIKTDRPLDITPKEESTTDSEDATVPESEA